MTSVERTPARAGSAIVRAAFLYFLLVFGVGVILGAPRTLWLAPRLGETLAVAIEAPVLILAMWFAALAAPRWAGQNAGGGALLAVGLLALALQQLADLALAFGLRGATLADQLTYFDTPAGAIYVVCLVAFALMPLVRTPRRS